MQKFLKYFGFLTLIFLAPSWSFASEPDLLSDLIKKMEIKSAKEFSYDSEFVSNESNQIIKSSGQVTLLPSLEAKWAQIQPTPKKTDATVKKGSFKGMEELGSADIFSIVSQIFLNFGEFAEAFPVQTIREKDGDIYAVLKGMPRTNIDEIIISYDHASAGVSLISLAFYDGHSGSLSFKPVLEKKLKVTSKERPRDEDRKLVDLGRLREIQSKLSANRYLTVDFEQTVYKSLRDRKRSSAGKAFFIKPDRFRWQLAKPTEKEWIYDGQQLINYFPQQKSAVRYDAQAPQAKELKQIVDMVLNLDSLLAKYNLVSAKENGSSLFLKLIPKQELQIEFAELEVDLKRNFISLVRLHFKGSDHTTFVFKSPSGQEIANNSFLVPDGTSIRSEL